MNTIKFAPYNELVTEQHNIETAKIVKHTINGKEYSFYEPCNFNLFITNHCHNTCSFCINRCEHETCSDEKYFEGLEKSLDILKDVDIEVTITGGEPTINPERFVKTLEILKKYKIRERTISTTGYKLFEKFNDKPLIQYLLEADYIHNISISRMSFNEEKNSAILGGKNNITNETLKSLGFFADVNEMELRVSTNLMNESINTYDDIINFVDDNHSIGINTVLFRELVGVKEAIKVAPFFEVIKNDDRFIYNTTLKGHFYDVIVYIYTSEKTGQKYIVKCYSGKSGNTDIVNSLSYNEGILRVGFTGEKIIL